MGRRKRVLCEKSGKFQRGDSGVRGGKPGDKTGMKTKGRHPKIFNTFRGGSWVKGLEKTAASGEGTESVRGARRGKFPELLKQSLHHGGGGKKGRGGRIVKEKLQ